MSEPFLISECCGADVADTQCHECDGTGEWEDEECGSCGGDGILVGSYECTECGESVD